jgi:hypothetical protein
VEGTKPVGRPILLTPELGERICNRVRAGLPIQLAAEYEGVSRQTVLEWVRRGEGREDADRPSSELFVDFANRYRRARAEYAMLLQQQCLDALRGVRAAKRRKDADGKPVLVKAHGAISRALEAHWHMSRRFPEFWGAGRETLGAIPEPDGTEDNGPPKIEIVLSKPKAADDEDDGEGEPPCGST